MTPIRKDNVNICLSLRNHKKIGNCVKLWTLAARYSMLVFYSAHNGLTMAVLNDLGLLTSSMYFPCFFYIECKQIDLFEDWQKLTVITVDLVNCH